MTLYTEVFRDRCLRGLHRPDLVRATDRGQPSNERRFDVTQSFSELFNPIPEQWRLRGDPFLWDELCAFLSAEEMPSSASAIRSMIERTITALTSAHTTALIISAWNAT